MGRRRPPKEPQDDPKVVALPQPPAPEPSDEAADASMYAQLMGAVAQESMTEDREIADKDRKIRLLLMTAAAAENVTAAVFADGMRRHILARMASGEPLNLQALANLLEAEAHLAQSSVADSSKAETSAWFDAPHEDAQ